MATISERVTANQADLDAIEQAALDYLEGYVTGDPDRHLRAYHPEAIKRRLVEDPDSGVTEQIVLSPQAMADYAATGETIEEDCDAEVFIDDVYEDIASVRVYSCNWVDFLHINFSHHVEHHLYPTVSYVLLPEIRQALRERFPDRYHEMSWTEGVRTVLSLPMGLVSHNRVADPDGSNECALPFGAYGQDPLPRAVAGGCVGEPG